MRYKERQTDSGALIKIKKYGRKVLVLGKCKVSENQRSKAKNTQFIVL